MNWIAVFSQSGKEIADIIDLTGITPLAIISHGPIDKSIDSRLEEYMIVHAINKEKVESAIELAKSILHPEVVEIVTLHGYLRIISPEICNIGIPIYNGHPAPIHLYPELKGKDKQEDQFIYKDKYPRIGSVIHKVIAELDAGEIILSKDIENNLTSIDDAYNTLRGVSLELWIEFFNKELYKEKK